MVYDLLILKEKDFLKFTERLDKDSKSRLVRDITFLKEFGAGLQMPFAKKVNKDLWELRTSGKQRVRVLYSIRGRQIYVLCWFIKKTRKIPAKEIQTALKRLTQV